MMVAKSTNVISFSQSSSLNTHKRTVHEGHKDYNCESCGKSVTSSQSLRNHIRTVHEGHKDHKCEHCEKSFGYSHHLKKHIRTRHKKSIHDMPK